MKNWLSFLLLLTITGTNTLSAQDSVLRWTTQRAWDWYNKQPWYCGFNYILLKKVVAWTRSAGPVQPLTIDVFDKNPRLNEIIFAASDIITFHNYENQEVLLSQIKDLKKHNRPVICTEWMNRPWKSTIGNNLEVFYEEKVGCMLWGLVNGKTQTDLPWGHRPGDPVPAIWQHDLYRGDFTPYDTTEISTLRKYISLSK